MPTSGKSILSPSLSGSHLGSPISLYFHIPFCTKKCHYCHFFVLPDKPELHKQLIEGLKLEIVHWAKELKGKRLVSIYFGGGTPSLLEAEEINEVLDTVYHHLPFDKTSIEITLEVNPESVTYQKMVSFAKAGINRVSIGVQTLEDALLKKLGRTHHAKAAIDTVNLTAQAGIVNISIDLMYDIPGQRLHSWKHTLGEATKLPISHLSLYNLTIEPNTVFFKYQESLKKILPDAECSAAMHKTAVSMLEEHGLQQYEISAFAREGLQSQHNSGYWTGRPFLGFGPSAFSYWQNKRFRSVAHFNRYLAALQKGESPIDFSEELEPKARRKELLAIALRLRAGVDCGVFESQHGALDQATHGVLKSLAGQNLLKQEGHHFSLTDQGVLFYDTIAVELI